MESETTAKTYSPIGHCIYCGTKTGKLSKEHIIPLGLGGNLILPKASCQSCAEATRDFEQFCLRSMYGPLRIRLRLPTRRPKERPNELPLEFIRVDGKKEELIIPSQEYPVACIGYRFPAPGILRGIPFDKGVEGDLIVRYVHQEINQHLIPEGQRVKFGSFNILKFCQMLAKIAHSYAIAEMGWGSFRPFLPDIILGRSSATTHLIGGDESSPYPTTEPFLHDIYRQHCLVNGVEYILVAVRLFAFIGMPRYHIVVGEII